MNCVSPRLLLSLTPTAVTPSDVCWYFNHWLYGTVFHFLFPQSFTFENPLPFPSFPVPNYSLPTFFNLPLFHSHLAQSPSLFPSRVPSLHPSLPFPFPLSSPLLASLSQPRSSSLWEREITVAERKHENQPTLFLIFKASDCVMLERGKGESQGEE